MKAFYQYLLIFVSVIQFTNAQNDNHITIGKNPEINYSNNISVSAKKQTIDDMKGETIPNTDGCIDYILKGINGYFYAINYKHYCEDDTSKILISSDNGRTWNSTSVDSLSIHILNMTINRKNGYIYIGSENRGILRSTDNCKSWKKVSCDSLNWFVPSVYADTNGNVFAIEFGTDVWHSSDNGENWENKYHCKGLKLFYNSLKISRKGNLFAIFCTDSLFRSTDNGDTWENVLKLGKDEFIYRLYIDEDGSIFATGNSNYLYLSKDDGNTWVTINIPELYSYPRVIFSKGDSCLLIAGNNRLFYSIDFGKNWLNISSVLPDSIDFINTIENTQNNEFLIGTCCKGIYRFNTDILSVQNIDIEEHCSIYPNPAEDILRINNSDKSERFSVKIINELGNIIYECNDLYDSVQIPTTGFSQGVYYSMIVSGNSIEYKKIIIIK
ncbi:MAG: hypothetical protein QG635_985 [Bacteroidota bacterium]|nr:hypothetical protein [Bacteroidota bacterium]